MVSLPHRYFCHVGRWDLKSHFIKRRGIQIRKLYEPKLFPDASMLPIFDKYFGPQTSGWEDELSTQKHGVLSMSVRSNMFPECYLECSLERALSCIDLAVGILSKYCNTGVGPNENLKKKVGPVRLLVHHGVQSSCRSSRRRKNISGWDLGVCAQWDGSQTQLTLQPLPSLRRPTTDVDGRWISFLKSHFVQ